MTDLKHSRRDKAGFSEPAPAEIKIPHSLEAEQGVLGCVLLMPADCMPELLDRLKVGKDVFYDIRHQTIYETLTVMNHAGEAIDIITLQQNLKNQKQLDMVGGLAYLNTLPDTVPSAANLSYYINIVLEKHTLRSLVNKCQEVIGRVYEHEGDVAVLMDEVERDMLAINDNQATQKTSTKKLVDSSLAELDKQFASGGKLSGISTGFIDLDYYTDGLHPADMIILSAQSSAGKTSLMMNIVEHVALESKEPVGVFSLEMTAESLMTRAMCSHARIDQRQLKRGHMNQGDFQRLTTAAVAFAHAPIFIDDECGISVMQFRSRCRRWKQQHGIKVFVVDYLQLLTSPEVAKRGNRTNEVGDISMAIKQTCKELGVTIIALSQLNEEGKLFESRKIFNDADSVWELVADEDGSISLKIRKQRNGPAGVSINLTFIKEIVRFENAARAPVSDND